MDNIVAIKNASYPSWSPDERWIAFLYEEGSQQSIYVVDANGGSPQKISGPGGRIGFEFGSADRIAWAPDSDRIVYAQDGDLFIARISTGSVERLTSTPAQESTVRFSPDGNQVVFLRDDDVWFKSVLTGDEIQVTDTAKSGWRSVAPQWSPDGGAILFTTTDTKPDATISVMQWDRLLVRPISLKENVARSQVKVGIFRLADKQTRWLAPDQPNVYSTRGSPVTQWSPDSKSVVINKISADQKQRQMLVAAASDGAAQVVFEERDEKWISPQSRWVQWSPDSKQILFCSEKTGWNQLYVVEVATRAVRELTHGAFTVQSPFEYDSREFSPVWSRDGKTIYFSARVNDPTAQQFYSIPAAGGEPVRITDNSGFYAAGVVSPRETRIAFLYSTPTQPWELCVLPNTHGAKPKKLTQSLPQELQGYSWIQPRFVEFPSRADGKAVHAQLFVPPGLDSTHKHPAIIHVHGEGYLQYVTSGWGAGTGGAQIYPFIQFLTAQDYVVLNVDFRGSSGYGRDWRVGVYRELGYVDLDDVLGGVDYLNKLGFIDMHRVGVFGRSYGGFMTLMAMFRAPEVFAAGVADRPVGNWERFFYLAAGYDLERFGAPPEALRDIYMRSSPVSYTQNLKGKLLIIGAMLDLMFPDVTELTTKLIRERKMFDLMIYPDEPHGFRKAENMVDVLQRTYDFLDKQLRAQRTPTGVPPGPESNTKAPTTERK